MSTILNQNSLVDTLNNFQQSWLSGAWLTSLEQDDLTAWLVSRQVTSGPGAGLFLAGPQDKLAATRLFTGERLATRFAFEHLLMAEAVRTLLLLHPGRIQPEIAARAEEKMLASCYATGCCSGECSHITLAFMRALAAGCDADAGPERLELLLTFLNEHRDGEGRWRHFPFYYTLLTLSEIQTPSAREELVYALTASERALKYTNGSGLIAGRRRQVLQKAVLLGSPAAPTSLFSIPFAEPICCPEEGPLDFPAPALSELELKTI